ncbi:DNA adenine methylase [Shinella pollutisoli]|uniref:DNA adenine methylase n=1 Tax=Shinella pollutisoli TaxID=2250594 RepID=A0ABV7DB59_9HYPH|nr:DNA adenine methylase [Shinella pollutisoli]
MSPTLPPLRWHGGKWLLAPWIISHFPRHRIYVEPFGGGASVLLRKTRAYAEVYNDLDEQVVTLFRVLQDSGATERLVAALEITPFARSEYEIAWDEADEPIEIARRLIIRSFMGFGSHAHADMSAGHKTTGFRANSNRSGSTPAHDWARYPFRIAGVVERMRGVVIERRPAIHVLRTHDSPETLHYVDPPYLPETRGRKNIYDAKHQYRHELTVAEHEELLSVLRDLTGMVVLSGYPADLYDDTLRDWTRVERQALADGARPRIEVLWINPVCAERLDREQSPLLFGGVA